MELKALIHESFWPCGLEGPFQSHAVGFVRLQRTGCHTIGPTAETDGLKQEEVRRIQPRYSRIHYLL